MNLIVAVDRNWAIGKDNELLVRIPRDMKYFREATTGKVVVLGRKTLAGFPNGEPLKNRTNIVLSRDEHLRIKGARVVHSVEECLEHVKNYAPGDVYVIGGESVYRALLPYCTIAEVTYIDHAYEADTYFPNLDEDPDWELVAETEEQTYFDLEFYWRKYERRQMG